MKRNTKRVEDTDVLAGEATIYRASDIRNELMRVLEKASPILIDLSGVPEIDSAGIQLLLAAKKAAAAQGKQLRFLSHSPALANIAMLLSLESQLDLQEATP